jgi:antibiotic biosynthesis monooxygenase (ABM) superfamily enzyme
MNGTQFSRIFCQTALVAAAVVSLATQVSAQQAAASLRSVTFYIVKPDRVADFQAAIKEYNAIAKKYGSTRYYTIWHSLTGPNEYLRADNYASWAALDAGQEEKLKDEAANLRAIANRITQCTESSRRVIDEVLPELSLPQSPEIPKMIRVLQTKVKPDKVAEYLELYKNEVLPAVKKSGVTFYDVAQSRYGSASTQFVTVAGLNSWSNLDGGFGAEKAMGKEGYQRFLVKIRPFIVESEYNIFSFMAALSYLPEATAGK